MTALGQASTADDAALQNTIIILQNNITNFITISIFAKEKVKWIVLLQNEMTVVELL